MEEIFPNNRLLTQDEMCEIGHLIIKMKFHPDGLFTHRYQKLILSFLSDSFCDDLYVDLLYQQGYRFNPNANTMLIPTEQIIEYVG